MNGPVTRGNGTHMKRGPGGLTEHDLDQRDRERMEHLQALRDAADAWHDAQAAEFARRLDHYADRPGCRGYCSQGRVPCAAPHECVIHLENGATARAARFAARFLRRFWAWLTGGRP